MNDKEDASVSAAAQPAEAASDAAKVSSTGENAPVQPTEGSPVAATSTGPGKIVLASLILVAPVANLNLSVANVALPSIGLAFDA
jgi:hypothetical protein